jgi:hypothetical protein
MSKEITISSDEIAVSIKSVGKTFSTKAFKDLMEKFEGKIAQMTGISKKHTVQGHGSEVRSIEIATTAKKLDKIIDGARMSVKRPYLDFNQSLDGMVRPLQKDLKAIEATQRKKCTAYRNDLLAKERAADLAALKLESQKKPEPANFAGLTLNIAKTPKPVKASEGTVNSVTAGSGSYKKELVATLTDITLVPAKYLTVDMKLVKADIKSGIVSIPGFTIENEMKMTIRS